MSRSARTLHEQSIVIDLVCPLANSEPHLDEWIRGGVTALGPTVAADDGLESAMAKIATWRARIRGLADRLLHVTTVADVQRAKREGKLGIIFHFQNTQPFERNVELVELYYRLGLRVAQLTYNTRNWVGDGCEEPANSGLSDFGRRIVREMNRVGMVVDLSHTGYRTTMDAMEVSAAPCIFSHANAYAVHGNGRNIRDDQIKALAASGGVIGLNGFPAFVGPRKWPTVDDLVRHARYIADTVGVDHVSVGIDYYQGQWPFAPDADAKAMYDAFVSSGRWSPKNYPPPPYKFPKGIEVPSKLAGLTDALSRGGFSPGEVAKILGGNLLRVFGKVWK